MSKTRIKVSAPSIKSRSQADDVLGRIRELTIHRNQTQLLLEKRRKELDDEYGALITADAVEIESLSESVRVWAEANPSEFGAKKSLETSHAVIGWRSGMPTLKAMSGWTWDRVLEKLKRLGRVEFIRTKEEVNKQGLLDQRETLGTDGLRELGLRVVQDEPFFIEPKMEETENRIAA